MYQAPAPLCPTPPSSPLGSSRQAKVLGPLPETRGLTSISQVFHRRGPTGGRPRRRADPVPAAMGGGTGADTTLLTVMDVSAFCSQSRVLIVAGKGGVGKTTMVAALAHLAAQAGLSVLVVELEGRAGVCRRLRQRRPPRLRRIGPGGGRGHRPSGRPTDERRHRHPGRDGPGPDHHPRRRPPRVPGRPRSAAGVQATDVVGDRRPGGRGHPRDQGRPGPGEGQADRAERHRRPGPGRRAGHRSHHDVPVIGGRPPRRRPGRPDPDPGGRRGRHAVRPGPLPGGPGHPARGDAGQRGRSRPPTSSRTRSGSPSGR